MAVKASAPRLRPTTQQTAALKNDLPNTLSTHSTLRAPAACASIMHDSTERRLPVTRPARCSAIMWYATRSSASTPARKASAPGIQLSGTGRPRPSSIAGGIMPAQTCQRRGGRGVLRLRGRVGWG